MYNSSYLDPSFFTSLSNQGWSAVRRRFHPMIHSINRPYLQHDNVAFPIHINNNHWVALCWRILYGITHYFYSDDMQNLSNECHVRTTIFSTPQFCPSNSVWVSCQRSTNSPHSNKCGPWKISALGVMMSHPNLNMHMLKPYRNNNLA